MSNPSDNFTAIYKATQQFQGLRVKRWLEHDLFSLAWWFLLVITVIPWIVWWRLADKKRLLELVCIGTMTSGISLVLDAVETINSW